MVEGTVTWKGQPLRFCFDEVVSIGALEAEAQNRSHLFHHKLPSSFLLKNTKTLEVYYDPTQPLPHRFELEVLSYSSGLCEREDVMFQHSIQQFNEAIANSCRGVIETRVELRRSLDKDETRRLLSKTSEDYLLEYNSWILNVNISKHMMQRSLGVRKEFWHDHAELSRVHPSLTFSQVSKRLNGLFYIIPDRPLRIEFQGGGDAFAEMCVKGAINGIQITKYCIVRFQPSKGGQTLIATVDPTCDGLLSFVESRQEARSFIREKMSLPDGLTVPPELFRV